MVIGRKRAANQGSRIYFEPTVVDQVSMSMLLNNEETFGPVVPVIEVNGYDEAIAFANRTGYGLQMARWPCTSIH